MGGGEGCRWIIGGGGFGVVPLDLKDGDEGGGFMIEREDCGGGFESGGRWVC